MKLLLFKSTEIVQSMSLQSMSLQHGTGAQPEIFQARRSFLKLGHFDKLFVKNKRKKGSAGKEFGAFTPRYS